MRKTSVSGYQLNERELDKKLLLLFTDPVVSNVVAKILQGAL